MTTYRFWGHVDPRGRTKPPLLGAAPVVEGDPWTLYLYEPIDSWGEYWGTSAAEFAAALRQVPSDAALTIAIASPGGEVFEAVAMASLIRQRSGPTTMRVDGLAASAASYLAVVGERTVMASAESYLMIHDPLTITIGNEADHLASAGLLGSFGDTMAAAYAGKMGGTADAARALMRAETWYNAAEAVAAGLADEVAGGGDQGDQEEAAPVAATYDLTIFRRPHPAARVAASIPYVQAPATGGRLTGPVLVGEQGPPPLVVPKNAPALAGHVFDPDTVRGILDALKGA